MTLPSNTTAGAHGHAGAALRRELGPREGRRRRLAQAQLRALRAGFARLCDQEHNYITPASLLAAWKACAASAAPIPPPSTRRSGSARATTRARATWTSPSTSRASAACCGRSPPAGPKVAPPPAPPGQRRARSPRQRRWKKAAPEKPAELQEATDLGVAVGTLQLFHAGARAAPAIRRAAPRSAAGRAGGGQLWAVGPGDEEYAAAVDGRFGGASRMAAVASRRGHRWLRLYAPPGVSAPPRASWGACRRACKISCSPAARAEQRLRGLDGRGGGLAVPDVSGVSAALARMRDDAAAGGRWAMRQDRGHLRAERAQGAGGAGFGR